MKTTLSNSEQGVSPVVAVILMVAVTVVLSAAIGAFVFDLGQSTTEAKQQSLGVTTQSTSYGVEVSIVTGSADYVRVLLNGEPATRIQSPSAGDTATVTAQKGDDITIVSESNGDKKVISTTTVDTTPSFNQGLVAHYRLGAGDGPTAIDTAQDNDGNISGATWTANDRFNSHLSFDGKDDYISSPVSPADVNPTSGITISAWFYVHNASEFHMIAVSDPGATDDDTYLALDDTGTLRWTTFDGNVNGLAYVGSYSTGTWTHIVGTYDGSSYHLYTNGKSVDSISESWTATSDIDYSIGGRPVIDDHYVNGSLDDVRIYNRSLSKDEVQNLYNATK